MKFLKDAYGVLHLKSSLCPFEIPEVYAVVSRKNLWSFLSSMYNWSLPSELAIS